MNNISDLKNIKIKINVAAGVIFRYDDINKKQVLLIKRSKNDHYPFFYEFPRGKCNRSEDIIKCLKREIKEETSLDITPVKLIDTIEYIADEGTRLTKCYNFLCQLIDNRQQVKLSKEHSVFRWISQLGEAMLMVQPEQYKTLSKVMSTENQIISYPSNNFTANNKVEEYLKWIQH